MTTPNGNVAAQGLSWTVFGAECLGAVYDLRWMIIFAVLLIATDFWWGCREEALKREQSVTRAEKERHKFHFSQAGRRTLNKAVDYLTYLLIGCVAGLAITEPMGLATHTTTAAIGLGFGCMFELSSVVGHICFVKGWDIRINWKKLFVAILTFKWKGLADVFDDAIEELDDESNPRKRHHNKPMQMDDYGMHEEHYQHHCGDDVNEEQLNEQGDEDIEESDEGI